MRCKETMHKLYDLLDRTLTFREEHEVQAHLAICPACRSEFQLAKNADDLLKATVMEMISEIEVPANLSQRIVQSITREKKSLTGLTMVSGLFRAPAFAAAILMLMMATGLFTYYKLFNPFLENPAVVLSTESRTATGSPGGTESVPVPEAAKFPALGTVGQGASEKEPAPLSGGAGLEQPAFNESTTTTVPYETNTPMMPAKTMMADSIEVPAGDNGGFAADTDTSSAEALDRLKAPSGRVGGEFNDAEEQAVNNLEDTFVITDEGSISMATGQPSGTGDLFMSRRTVLRQGTLQEAARAVGFTPIAQGYLPPGAELKEVTWESGAIYLEYQVGHSSFMFTQSRVSEAALTWEEGGQVIDLNGIKAYLQETGSGYDPLDVYTTVRWRCNEWLFTVQGNLSREEILKVALSIRV